MISGDLKYRSRLTIYEFDLYLVRQLHTKAEVPTVIVLICNRLTVAINDM
jgi:hypothetical protein